jgi:hypothetical protein
MHTLLRRGLALTLLVALCFSLSSCDLFGIGEPDWTGNYEVTNADELTYWLLSEDEQEIRSFSGNNPDNCVGSLTLDITDTSDDEFTVSGPEGEEVTVDIEGSGDEITATIEGGQERRLSSVDSVPDCDQ